MTSQFTTSHGSVYMDTARLSDERMDELAALWEREEAYEAADALRAARRQASGGLPVLRPITTPVRQLDAEAWGDALAEVS